MLKKCGTQLSMSMNIAAKSKKAQRILKDIIVENFQNVKKKKKIQA